MPDSVAAMEIEVRTDESSKSETETGTLRDLFYFATTTDYILLCMAALAQIATGALMVSPNLFFGDTVGTAGNGALGIDAFMPAMIGFSAMGGGLVVAGAIAFTTVTVL